MSEGDAQRRENHRAELRERLRREEDLQASFSPQLTAAAKCVRGKLRVQEEPQEYVERMREAQGVHLAWRRQEVERNLERALSQCTFRPKVNSGAPSFVTCMAACHKAKQNLKDTETEAKGELGTAADRPDWQ